MSRMPLRLRATCLPRTPRIILAWSPIWADDKRTSTKSIKIQHLTQHFYRHFTQHREVLQKRPCEAWEGAWWNSGLNRERRCRPHRNKPELIDPHSRAMELSCSIHNAPCLAFTKRWYGWYVLWLCKLCEYHLWFCWIFWISCTQRRPFPFCRLRMVFSAPKDPWHLHQAVSHSSKHGNFPGFIPLDAWFNRADCVSTPCGFCHQARSLCWLCWVCAFSAFRWRPEIWLCSFLWCHCSRSSDSRGTLYEIQYIKSLPLSHHISILYCTYIRTQMFYTTLLWWKWDSFEHFESKEQAGKLILMRVVCQECSLSRGHISKHDQTVIFSYGT